MPAQTRARSSALTLSDLGFLAVLLAANLVAFAPDILTSALYPSLAVRLGVPLETAVLLTTPRALGQLGILALGPLSDRVGPGWVLAGGALLVAVGAWGAAATSSMAVMLAVQLAFGLGFAVAMATIPAIVGDRYPYARRGQALGIVRLSMPLALIVVVPALVALANRHSVVAAYGGLGAVASLVFALAAWRLPRVAGRRTGREVSPEARPAHWLRPRVILLLLLSVGFSMAPAAVFGFLGSWVTETFGDPARNVGLALTSDGMGALAGASLGALLIDRLTKRRAGIAALALAGTFALAIAAAQHALGPALPAIVGFSASLEIATIALPALLSEAAPQARGTVMSLWAAAFASGAAIAPIVARYLWLQGGMGAIAGAGGVLLLLLAGGFAAAAVEPRTA